MFTGIVYGLATVAALLPGETGARIAIDLSPLEGRIGAPGIGDSLAISGTCLTVVDYTGNTVTFDVVKETLDRTTLGRLRVGDRVNLEPSLRLGDSLGGHFVQGHVDGVGRILERRPEGEQTTFRIAAPPEVVGLTIEKGSIAVDGISLTVVSVGADWFSVAIIPHTLAITTLGYKQVGDEVNLEIDLLGKWVKKLLAPMVGGV